MFFLSDIIFIPEALQVGALFLYVAYKHNSQYKFRKVQMQRLK